MACKIKKKIIFKSKYFSIWIFFYLKCTFEDTDIDCSMCSTILPSGDSSGTTLEVPSEALLHRSKLQGSIAASNNYLPKFIKNVNIL